jgi:hypothetical protein
LQMTGRTHRDPSTDRLLVQSFFEATTPKPRSYDGVFLQAR